MARAPRCGARRNAWSAAGRSVSPHIVRRVQDNGYGDIYQLVQPRRDAHAHELLEEELGSVGNVNLRDGRAVAASAAFKRVLAQVRDRGQAAQIAYVQAVGVACIVHAFLEEVGHAVRDHTVALHLTETKTTIAAAALDRLAREDLHRTTCTAVDLVINHVLQALVIRWTKIHLRLQLAASVAIVHHFQTT